MDEKTKYEFKKKYIHQSWRAQSIVRIFWIVLSFVSTTASASPAVLHIAAEGLSCPKKSEVREALERRLGVGRVVSGAAQEELTLRLSSNAPGHLWIALIHGTNKASRTVRSKPLECSDLAETVSLLVDTWLKQDPWNAYGLTPQTSSKTTFLPKIGPTPRISPSQNSISEQAIVAESSAITKPFTEPKTPDLPSTQRSSDLSNVPPSEKLQPQPDLVEPPPKTIRPNAIPSLEPWFSVAFLAGGFYSGSPQRGLEGIGQLELVPSRAWTMGFDARAGTFVKLSSSPGTIKASMQSLSAFGRYAIHPPRANGWDILGGIGLARISSDSQGYFKNSHKAVYDVQVLVCLRWKALLWRQLAAVAEGGALLRLHQDSFSVEGIEPVLLIPRWRMFLSVGPSWAF